MENALYRTVTRLLIVSFALFGASAHGIEEKLAGELVIEGTGDSQELLRAMAKRFEEIYPDTTIKVPDSIGSSGGIKAAGTGNADLGRVARQIKEKEKKYGLTYKLFAKSPVVFVVHLSVEGIDNLTFEQIVEIYSGKITNWNQLGSKTHKIYPIGREPGDSCKTLLETHIPGFKEITTPAAQIYYTTPEAIEALVEHEYTLGYVPMAMIATTNLQIVKVGGISPSLENMKQGKYPMILPFGIVYKEPLKPLAKAFVNLLFSAEGRQIIGEYGCLPTPIID